jgi:hypothetical protein
MAARRARWDAVLAGVVVGHLAVALAHGAAHQGAEISLSPLGNLFVVIVIIAGPLVGLVWSRTTHSSTGAWLIAATMAGALLFGLVNHFFIVSPDHVSQVPVPWRPWFGTTAVLLLITEAIGAGVGIWCATNVGRRSS